MNLIFPRLFTVSIIGLASEVFICKQICEATHGRYRVCRNEHHFMELLHEHLQPPPVKKNGTKAEQEMDEVVAIESGFPVFRRVAEPSLCAWYGIFLTFLSVFVMYR